MSKKEIAELTELIPGIYVVPGVTNVGVITDNRHPETNVYLVDTGRTEEQGALVLNAIERFFGARGTAYKIKAIINTHAHADHAGADEGSCKILIFWRGENATEMAFFSVFALLYREKISK